MRRALISAIAALALAGCTVTSGPVGPTSSRPAPSSPSSRAVPADFRTVVQRVEPVAEQVCRQQRGPENCDFKILVDNRASSPPNAFQTLDKNGRPVIVFTRALLTEMRNADEVAFVLGHEAAHHIEDHIPRTQRTAVGAAVLAGILAAAAGGNSTAVEQAQQLGGQAGSRAFSKGYELEADRLGTIITDRAGYDPVRGAEFFSRIPDPGDQFLGTHPPNADRQRIVRQTAAQLN